MQKRQRLKQLSGSRLFVRQRARHMSHVALDRCFGLPQHGFGQQASGQDMRTQRHTFGRSPSRRLLALAVPDTDAEVRSRVAVLPFEGCVEADTLFGQFGTSF